MADHLIKNFFQFHVYSRSHITIQKHSSFQIVEHPTQSHITFKHAY